MRILNWNIDEGGRTGMVDEIVEISLAMAPDAIVLPEYRKDKPQIKNQFVARGFKPHVPVTGYETGNQVAIFTKTELGFETQESIKIPQLEGVTVFCNNGLWTIGGVFFPKKAKDTPSIHPFLEWLAEDSFKLSKCPTVLTGDFNHGVQASTWNKGKTGSEYNLLRRWVDQGIWADCCPKPDPSCEYLRTYCRSRTALPEPGQRWAKGSSRPDHYFVSRLVTFNSVRVLNGHISRGISDHEPMVGDFSVAEDEVQKAS